MFRKSGRHEEIPSVAVIMLTRGKLEVSLVDKVIQFGGELCCSSFEANIGDMRWTHPEQRDGTAEEFAGLVPLLKAAYKAMPRKERVPVDFFDSKGKRRLKLR